ncbi:hypothetical protein [Gymnodinialimonas sp. 57CJ19]|uniref:hypothetical protein n=1 Tax=Gymnodinialimonas sp. 57CJ19 TaxID=3138498 RepID=UPI0031345CDD
MIVEDVDISPFGYGVLALSNPSNWSNEPECEQFSHLLTGKSVYVWALVFASYTWHLEQRKNLEFKPDLERIDEYIGRHFAEFREANPVDFSNAGKQYVRSKPGSFQSIRKNFGAAPKKLQIPEAERRLTSELSLLEERGLIVDPFTVTTAGIVVAVLGSVPFAFTRRTDEGDEKYLQIRAMLWEFESLTKEEKREVRFHFFMEKAIKKLKKHVKLMVDDEIT